MLVVVVGTAVVSGVILPASPLKVNYRELHNLHITTQVWPDQTSSSIFFLFNELNTKVMKLPVVGPLREFREDRIGSFVAFPVLIIIPFNLQYTILLPPAQWQTPRRTSV